jgi:hypothetical protein
VSGDRAGPDRSNLSNVTVAESTGSYDDWRERFIALTDHTGVIARTSAIPVLVGIGHAFDQLCVDLKESFHEMGSWRWPVWPDSAILIDGTLKMFEAIERVLGAAVARDGAACDDSLEKAWNESILALLEEAAQLKGEFIAGVRVAPREIDPQAG